MYHIKSIIIIYCNNTQTIYIKDILLPSTNVIDTTDNADINLKNAVKNVESDENVENVDTIKSTHIGKTLTITETDSVKKSVDNKVTKSNYFEKQCENIYIIL